MSDETGGRRRRDDGDDDAAPAPRSGTPAGRRRREVSGATASAGSTPSGPVSGGGTATGVKGAPTPSRESRSTTTAGSPVARLQRFLREVVAELRKVHWPSRRQIVVYTFVVLVFVTFMVTLVYLLDLAFAKAVFAIFS